MVLYTNDKRDKQKGKKLAARKILILSPPKRFDGYSRFRYTKFVQTPMLQLIVRLHSLSADSLNTKSPLEPLRRRERKILTLRKRGRKTTYKLENIYWHGARFVQRM